MRLIPGMMLFCLLTFQTFAQSKKDLKVQQALLSAQVEQLKDRVLSLQRENRSLKENLNSCRDSIIEVSPGSPVDSLSTTLEKIRLENDRLREELYNTRLSRAEKKLHPNLKLKEYMVKDADERKEMAILHKEPYLSNCLRFNNPQRLFTEEIIVEFEIHPLTSEVRGFMRKRYVPEIGSDQYNLQRIKGYISRGDNLDTLHISSLDGKRVEIEILFGRDRDLYNEVIGEDEDLASINTYYGGIREFSLEVCRLEKRG